MNKSQVIHDSRAIYSDLHIYLDKLGLGVSWFDDQFVAKPYQIGYLTSDRIWLTAGFSRSISLNPFDQVRASIDICKTICGDLRSMVNSLRKDLMDLDGIYEVAPYPFITKIKKEFSNGSYGKVVSYDIFFYTYIECALDIGGELKLAMVEIVVKSTTLTINPILIQSKLDKLRNGYSNRLDYSDNTIILSTKLRYG